MAKTSMKVKQQRAPKFSTRAYTRCTICGRPHSVLRKYGICNWICHFKCSSLNNSLVSLTGTTSIVHAYIAYGSTPYNYVNAYISR